MSLWNPWAPSFGWKIDPDRRQDRSCSQVTTRQMTEEEMKKYGILMKGEDGEMTKRLNVDHEELLAICRKFGTDKEAYTAVAEKFDISEKQASNQIFNQRIRRELEAERLQSRTSAAEGSKEQLPENTSQEGPLPETTEVAQDSNNQPEVINNADASDKMEPEEYPDLKETVKPPMADTYYHMKLVPRNSTLEHYDNNIDVFIKGKLIKAFIADIFSGYYIRIHDANCEGFMLD